MLVILVEQVAVVADIFGYLLFYLLDQIKLILLCEIVQENQLFVFVSLPEFGERVKIYGIFE